MLALLRGMALLLVVALGACDLSSVGAYRDLGADEDAGGEGDLGSADLASPVDDLAAHTDFSAPADLATIDLATAPDLAAALDLATARDLATPPDLSTPVDLSTPLDLSTPRDLATPPDLVAPRDLSSPPDLAQAGGVITGGPCISGATGATAFRVRWQNGGGTAYVNYEVWGLPDKTRSKVSAYGYNFGFTPAFVDPFLGDGGLQLDGSDFVDVELSTAGVSSIRRATLSIYGRSYNTTASGSFSWQTFTGVNATPTNFVSNVAPYRWYGGDATAEIRAGDSGILLRIKAGPSSGSLVVNRIELCLDAS